MTRSLQPAAGRNGELRPCVKCRTEAGDIKRSLSHFKRRVVGEHPGKYGPHQELECGHEAQFVDMSGADRHPDAVCPLWNVSADACELEPEDRFALERLWGEAGTWVADTWPDLVARCFDGSLPYGGVVWGLTPHGHHLGHTSAATGRITLHPALLDPQDEEVWSVPEAVLGVRYASDVLLHEMVHVRLLGVPHGPDGPHNTEAWCEEIMRITPLLGLARVTAEPVKPRRINGKVTRAARDGYLSRDAIARWPHTLRSPSYYVADNRKIYVPI